MDALRAITSTVYDRIFVRPWSPYAGAVCVIAIVIVLLTQDLFWGVVGGLRLWGDHLNAALGLLHQRLSLMDIGLVIGAACAALLARQFGLRRAQPLEYVAGAVGGTLMGAGAALAGGCTVGGFFVPVLLASAAGWSMWLGLIVGAFLGLHSLAWLAAHANLGSAPAAVRLPALRRWAPTAGIVLAGSVGAWIWVSPADASLP